MTTQAVTAAAEAVPVLFGLKLYELLTLVGIVIGPILAVAITLVVERVRSRRDRQLNVLRMLLATYRTAGDPSWSVAMNLILVEFNQNAKVMAARREYMAAVSQRATPENEASHIENMGIKQTALVYQVAQALGFKLTEGELRTNAYLSQTVLDRDALLIDSQRAMRDIATTLQQQAELTKALVTNQAQQTHV